LGVGFGVGFGSGGGFGAGVGVWGFPGGELGAADGLDTLGVVTGADAGVGAELTGAGRPAPAAGVATRRGGFSPGTKITWG
jgi:hypothetical protein